jgi:hypothetical protein
MTHATAVHPHDKLLVASGILTLFGLGLAILYVLNSTPYTMVAFLALGQMTIVVAGATFVAVLIWDLRSRIHAVVEKQFAAGETVFRQGDYPDRLYLIGTGEAEAVKVAPDGSEVPVARIKEGEFFGEIGVLSNVPRTATVRAVTAMKVLSIHRGYLDPLMTYMPGWKDRIIDEYMQRKARDEERR